MSELTDLSVCGNAAIDFADNSRGGSARDVIEAMAARLATGEAPSVAVQLITGLPDDLRALVSVGERSGSLL